MQSTTQGKTVILTSKTWCHGYKRCLCDLPPNPTTAIVFNRAAATSTTFVASTAAPTALASAAMEEIEELLAKVIASMSNLAPPHPRSNPHRATPSSPPHAAAGSPIVKYPDNDVELATNPSSAAATGDTELASANPSFAAAANVKSSLSDVRSVPLSANPSPPAVDVAELASMPSSSPIEIKSPGNRDLGELVSITASAGKVKSAAS